MDAALDILAKSASIGGGASSSAVRAHVVGQGVFTLSWNQRMRIVVPPGDHWVAIWTHLVRRKHQGLSHAVVHVDAGRVVALQWQNPYTVFGTGAITLLPFGPATGPAPADREPAPPGLGPCQLTVTAGHGARALDDGELPGGAVSPVASWHPDPSGRSPLRWWDGVRWTEDVSDGSTSTSDPVGGL